jgi:hypothetical protein
MDLPDKIKDTIERAINAEKGRIVHEETEKCMNNVRRRLADAAARVVTQISCQLVDEGETYKVTIELPAAGVAKMQGENRG